MFSDILAPPPKVLISQQRPSSGLIIISNTCLQTTQELPPRGCFPHEITTKQAGRMKNPEPKTFHRNLCNQV
jgi:hypothetical protein